MLKHLLSQKKKWDNLQLYTQFIRPYDFINQVNKNDYLKLFSNIDKNLLNNDIIKNISNIKGELDAFTNISLKKGNAIITNINCNAVHTGFSQRNWVDVIGRDLYKGNGRIRQESYTIEQGPFQSIIINSFQSEEILKGSLHSYDIGGEYHFDIHIFRNNKLFPNYKSYEHINIHKIKPILKEKGYSLGHNEEARRTCIMEFFKAIIEKTPIPKQTSNFLTHDLTTKILSLIYLSASEQYNNKNGIIKHII